MPADLLPRPAAGADLPLAGRLLPGVVQGGETTFARHHQLLASLPSMLAVAPLETEGSPETVEFVAGKSDVKMVEYAGFAHPAVFSDAAPYADSDLACGTVVANAFEAWSTALEATWEDGWRTAIEEQARVRERRHISAVADRCWGRALDAADWTSP